MRNRKPTKPCQHRVECPVARPLVEEVPCGRPWSVYGRNISPWCARTQHPEDGIENLSTVARSATGLETPGREQVGDQLPLRVGEAVSRHACLGHASV